MCEWNVSLKPPSLQTDHLRGGLLDHPQPRRLRLRACQTCSVARRRRSRFVQLSHSQHNILRRAVGATLFMFACFSCQGRGMNAAFAIGRLCDLEEGRKRLLFLAESERMVGLEAANLYSSTSNFVLSFRFLFSRKCCAVAIPVRARTPASPSAAWRRAKKATLVC